MIFIRFFIPTHLRSFFNFRPVLKLLSCLLQNRDFFHLSPRCRIAVLTREVFFFPASRFAGHKHVRNHCNDGD